MSDGDIHRHEQQLKNNVRRIKEADHITDDQTQLLLRFKDFMAAQDLSTSRINRYLYSWQKMMQHVDFDLEDPDKDDLVRLIGKINQNEIWGREVSPHTRVEYKKAVNKFYRDFISSRRSDFDGDRMTDFYTLTINEQYEDPDRLPGADTARKMVQRADRLRDKALIMTLWSTGGRISEVLGLRWKDVKIRDEIARVTFRDTKTGDNRTVPIHAGHLYLQELRQQDHRGGDPEAFVFRSYRGDDQVSYGSAATVLERVREKADVPQKIKTSPHNWRKGRATFFAARGRNQAWLCDYFGWVQGSSEAAKYIRMAESDVEAGIRDVAGLDQVEEDLEEDLNPVRCHECGTWNRFESLQCDSCNTTLAAGDLFDEVRVQETAEKLQWSILRENIPLDEADIREKARELVEERVNES